MLKVIMELYYVRRRRLFIFIASGEVFVLQVYLFIFRNIAEAVN